MGLYELVLRSNFFAQNCINRWNYVSAGTPGTSHPSFGLAVSFGAVDTAGLFPGGTVLGNLQAILSAAVHFTSIQVKNIYDPTDFYEVFFPDDPVGGQAGDAGSPFQAYGFVSNQVSLAIAKGHKRFVGVTEGIVASGGAIRPESLGGFTSQATLMSAILAYGADGAALTFSPAIASKEKYESNPVKHLFSYRYYATEAAQLAHTAFPVTWGVMIDIRSQVSRQYGRGI